jgi:pantoate--beta-alanine ligase
MVTRVDTIRYGNYSITKVKLLKAIIDRIRSIMRIIHNLDEMNETARGWLAGGLVGFVPTMGFLHGGHLSLVQAARRECETSVACIFVNPLQFATQEDLLRYPRNLERDLQVLRDANVDAVFAPRGEDLYPPHFSTYVEPTGPTIEHLAIISGPQYIRGIATIMTKLFQIVRPDVAFFSQKNAQKIAIVRKIVQDLNIDVALQVLPTVRESDGLAMSSQNPSLSPAQRQAAPLLYRALMAARMLIERGERSSAVVLETIRGMLAAEPALLLDYAVVCHPSTFLPLESLRTGSMLAVAASCGPIRLVDNIVWLEDGQWLL